MKIKKETASKGFRVTRVRNDKRKIRGTELKSWYLSPNATTPGKIMGTSLIHRKANRGVDNEQSKEEEAKRPGLF